MEASDNDNFFSVFYLCCSCEGTWKKKKLKNEDHFELSHKIFNHLNEHKFGSGFKDTLKSLCLRNIKDTTTTHAFLDYVFLKASWEIFILSHSNLCSFM